MEADWKKKMSLIQTRCLSWKSWKTHLITVRIRCINLEQQLLFTVSLPTGEAEEGCTKLLPLNPLSEDLAAIVGNVGAVSLGKLFVLVGIMLSQQMLPNLDEGCWLSWSLSLWPVDFSMTSLFWLSKFATLPLSCWNKQKEKRLKPVSRAVYPEVWVGLVGAGKC